ncbi:MAG: gamma-glutamylcyclotransferase [Azospirillaceae bacterium]
MDDSSETPTQRTPATAASPITRESLKNGVIAEMIRRHDSSLRLLTDAERAASLEATLAAGPVSGWRGGDVWVFGYGSLIWNPAFHFVERRHARIHGYHRRFCLWTPLGRGTPDNPGLMLGLEPGGSCHGVVFRIAEAAVREELEIVWRREMVAGSYRPTWVTALTGGRRVPAITFVMNRRNERYSGRLEEERVVRTLSTACGQLGSCRDYLFNTVEHLDEMGIRDRHLHRLYQQVRAVAPRSATP